MKTKRKITHIQAYGDGISYQLILEGYPHKVKFNDQKIVRHAFWGFSGLMFDLGLSPHSDQNFTIKLEVDTSPPQGAGLTTTLIRYRELFLNIQHHDEASLLAENVHAVLQRAYLKGRDIFDLVWYLSDRSWPLPNFVMLNNALSQSGWEGPTLSESNWKSALLNQLSRFDFQRIKDDVRPFLTSLGIGHSSNGTRSKGCAWINGFSSKPSVCDQTPTSFLKTISTSVSCRVKWMGLN